MLNGTILPEEQEQCDAAHLVGSQPHKQAVYIVCRHVHKVNFLLKTIRDCVLTDLFSIRPVGKKNEKKMASKTAFHGRSARQHALYTVAFHPHNHHKVMEIGL